MGSWFSRDHQSQVTGSINDLSDNDLAIVFKHLPPYDRLIVSEVCQRWNGISRIPWADIVCIDLTTIPVENLAAIIRLCPNLRTVFALRAKLDCKALHIFSRAPLLASVKLYSSIISIPVLGAENTDLFSALFSERLLNTGLQELVLQNVRADVSGPFQSGFLAGNLPLSLTRLHLSGLRVESPWPLWTFFLPSLGRELLNSMRDVQNALFYVLHNRVFLNGIGSLQNLTCLILHGGNGCCLTMGALLQAQTFSELEKLKNLRELCIGLYDSYGLSTLLDIGRLPFLPKLQVLFLFNVTNTSEEHLVRLATVHPNLRILVIGGHFGQVRTIPVRRLYPDGFGSEPLPRLHVFLGKQSSEKIRFMKSPAPALRVYPISEHLPTFLESEEIAPIFDGVWIAAHIKEGAKHGARLYDGGDAAATSIIFLDQA